MHVIKNIRIRHEALMKQARACTRPSRMATRLTKNFCTVHACNTSEVLLQLYSRRKSHFLFPTNVVAAILHEDFPATFELKLLLLEKEVTYTGITRFTNEQILAWVFFYTNHGTEFSKLFRKAYDNSLFDITPKQYFAKVEKLLTDRGRLTYRDIVGTIQYRKGGKYLYLPETSFTMAWNLAWDGITYAHDHSGATTFAMFCSFVKNAKSLAEKDKARHVAHLIILAVTGTTESYFCHSNPIVRVNLAMNLFDLLKDSRKADGNNKFYNSVVVLCKTQYQEWHEQKEMPIQQMLVELP